MHTQWTQAEALMLCRIVEIYAPQYGCHVALTGGCLYKDGVRKDCDLLFYRIRQVEKIDVDGLWKALAGIGFVQTSGFGWVYKGTFNGKNVDCFFPESKGDQEYPEPPETAGAWPLR